MSQEIIVPSFSVIAVMSLDLTNQKEVLKFIIMASAMKLSKADIAILFEFVRILRFIRQVTAVKKVTIHHSQ